VAAVAAVAGGARGGGAALTQAGTALVRDYREMEARAADAISLPLAGLMRRIP